MVSRYRQKLPLKLLSLRHHFNYPHNSKLLNAFQLVIRLTGAQLYANEMPPDGRCCFRFKVNKCRSFQIESFTLLVFFFRC